MPDIHVHLCALDRVRQWPGLHPLVLEAVSRNPRVARLGAVLPDLVAMDPGWLRRGIRQVFGESGWAPLSALAHQRDASTLLLALAQPRASSLLGPLRRLALAAGFASHVLLDRQLDAQVWRLIDDEGLTPGPVRRRRFAQLEIEQAAALQAQGCVSLRLTPQQLSPVPQVSGEQRVVHHVNDALQVVMGQRPRPRDWQTWAVGLQRHMRRRASRQDRGLSAQATDARWPDLRQGYEEAITASVVALQALAEAFEPGDLLPSALLHLSRRDLLDPSDKPRDARAP